jgi:hypothetical protein
MLQDSNGPVLVFMNFFFITWIKSYDLMDNGGTIFQISNKKQQFLSLANGAHVTQL